MDLVERSVRFIEERKQRLESGKINCIPSPLVKFKYDFPGTEQATYYLISGGAKASKSKFTNFIFLFNTILYIYEHPDLIRLKIFYALLEETQMNIMLKFMCYVLFVKYRIRTDIKELKSIEQGRSIKSEVLDIIKSIEMQSILYFFEEHIEWIPDRNPTGIFNTLEKYAQSHGIIHRKWSEPLKKEIFDWYEPNDPDEYVLCIIDHIGLISTERGFDLRESIKKLSEYLKIVRNKYGYSPVVVQQQNSQTLNLEAFKASKIFPSQTGLLDCQDTSRDCDIFLGIVNPYSFEFKVFGENNGYDITKLRSYARWLKVVQGRDGESDATLGMYFDGATGWYAALPHYTNTVELNKVYQLVQRNRQISS
jgi:hypothetical protein